MSHSGEESNFSILMIDCKKFYLLDAHVDSGPHDVFGFRVHEKEIHKKDTNYKKNHLFSITMA